MATKRKTTGRKGIRRIRTRSTSKKGARVSRRKTKIPRYVYYFGDGHADGSGSMKPLLGGKGANLHEMTRIGLPVPPGFTLTTEVCSYFYGHKRSYPPQLERSEEHTSELQSPDQHTFPTRRSSDLKTKIPRYVYYFGDGHADGSGSMKPLLGGKGANLHEMTRIGLPVPPGFTLTTEVCSYFYGHKRSYPPQLE